MEKLGNVLIKVMEDLSKISTNGSAYVRVNQSICQPEEFRTLFDYFSRGTILEHVDMEVDPLPTRMECSCGYKKEVSGDHPGYMKCPNCGRFAEIKDEPYEMVEPDPKNAGRRTSIRF